MIKNNDSETAYAFLLDDIKGKYLYYRTVSKWVGFGEHGRDKRKPEPVIVTNFKYHMDLIGESFMWIHTDDDLGCWMNQFGWILTSTSFAETRLGFLMQKCICQRSPIGLFWNKEIRRNRACSRRIPPDIRQRVLDRDGHKCIECGRSEEDGAILTMDHVIPFSRGG
ncbi:MAG: HNH endonuclease [bacterium]